MKKLFVAVLVLFNSVIAIAQDMLTPVQYIEMYKDIAIREMKRMGVPAAITLAQGILETESGNSVLVKKSNNHFGIKCKSNWTGGSVSHDDDASGECFRLYKTADDSYRDHSNFLRAGTRYSFLFKLDVRDYKGWAYGLKKAGYATNPAYPQILIKHIEQYNLQQYTLAAANEVATFEEGKYQDDPEEKVVAEKTATPVADETSMLDVSDNVITVNGSKCVIAGKGTSLLVVATKNNIPLSRMLGFNELAEDGMLIKNQYVYLEKKSKTGDKDFHVTKAEESLYDIAQKNGIQLQYMLDYNKLWGNEDIKPGTKIYLKPGIVPAKVAVTAATATIPVTSAKTTHTVEAKEGLYAIARKYNISVQQLKDLNNLHSDSLSIGQELIISK
ncbi:glucosaminidase domain-containing protein [Ferruginibacter sp.]|nr:LysM peptidoglycan-binding domain-containing protein [Ferruginibacter sp.]